MKKEKDSVTSSSTTTTTTTTTASSLSPNKNENNNNDDDDGNRNATLAEQPVTQTWTQQRQRQPNGGKPVRNNNSSSSSNNNNDINNNNQNGLEKMAQNLRRGLAVAALNKRKICFQNFKRNVVHNNNNNNETPSTQSWSRSSSSTTSTSTSVCSNMRSQSDFHVKTQNGKDHNKESRGDSLDSSSSLSSTTTVSSCTILSTTNPSSNTEAVTNNSSNNNSSSNNKIPPNVVLYDAVLDWTRCLDALWKSSEMNALQSQTLYVMFALPQAVLQTALFPISVVTNNTPLLLLLRATTDAAQKHNVSALSLSSSSLSTKPSSSSHTLTCSNQVATATTTSSSSSSLLTTNLVNGLFSISQQAVGLLGKVTYQVAHDVCSVLAPTPQTRRRRCELKKDPMILNRLQMESYPEEEEEEDDNDDEEEEVSEDVLIVREGETKTVQRRVVRRRRESAFLLRVADVLLLVDQDATTTTTTTTTKDSDQELKETATIAYIDFCPESNGNNTTTTTQQRRLIRRAMDQLVMRGLTLVSNHPTVRLHNPNYNFDTTTTTTSEMMMGKEMEWKCEGSTTQLLRRLLKQSVMERLHTLQSETLIWSGKFHKNYKDNKNSNCLSNYGHEFPFYLARGILPIAPLELLQLLWDNDRTSEYNQFCLGRKTLLDLEDEETEDENDDNNNKKTKVPPMTNKKDMPALGTGRKSKVIESETRVPMTSFTVNVRCLMHSRPLEEPHDHGYVIFSRSLTSGPAGNTTTTTTTTTTNSQNSNGDSTDSGGNKTQKERRRKSQRMNKQGNKNKNNKNNNTNEILWGMNVIRSVPNHPQLTDLTTFSQVGYTLGVIPQFLASQIAIRGVCEFFETIRRTKKY